MSEYRRLAYGEVIQWGDEIDRCSDGGRDEPKWEPVHAGDVGKRAPDPQYPSHRQYRRLVEPVAPVPVESAVETAISIVVTAIVFVLLVLGVAFLVAR